MHCGEEARRILPDLLEGARQCDIRKALRKAMEDAATAKRQMDLPGVKLHSVRTDKPAKPPGAA